MSDSDKEGAYCTVCGGISPGKVATKMIMVNGKSIGIDKLDRIIEEVRALDLLDHCAITEELLKRAKVFNYIPSSRSKDYGEALLAEYLKG